MIIFGNLIYSEPTTQVQPPYCRERWSRKLTVRNCPLSPLVSVLLINAIAILSEDRFLARSTSLPPVIV